MPKQKIEFTNANGSRLAGLLETPDGDAKPARYALFAHCFTCGKDIAAASRIARALAAQGIAVLRFDFTGLGSSDGDFANSNFSSNVQDLLAAADWLRREHTAPQLLIGHSLGGAAVLAAAARIDEAEAICTIAAPATADHVRHLFQDAESEIQTAGRARVKIGLRAFSIEKQLLDDLDTHATTEHIARLRRALLIFHSPVDKIVPVDEAAKIYQAAKHPKSFVSLDKADHLLSNARDAEYVATTIGAWASRYIREQPDSDESVAAAPEVAANEVLITEGDHKFRRGLHTASHHLTADEPASVGGGNAGPTPYDLLLMSLGACTSMTLRLYANRNKIPLEDVKVWLTHERIHADDCAECENKTGQIERITRRIRLRGPLDDQQIARLIRIADRCPVHRTLESAPIITTRADEESGQSLRQGDRR
ncbi:bifunctional alpha/beta hydrolase/OsmC family protein [Salinisphaera sp. P385]|uniref:Bifunctional alpha/beta hydrolase/OsmC family protein n=1 Tax=Spectribacter acetivorans TaxID=3075603 RepID=A0ABU3B965_9GAMM|nr:bifunctional alpha/beta hydrolase/OsmC family protein [Salinisphaera sp. P385]MDT0618615.1 bifunctional alpha/beta hydrolase/OsmC family protein [Salinisphaera sp. P385]